MTQQLQQQIQPMPGRPMDERITSLEVRVGGIEDGIKTIVGKLDSRDRIPWAVIGTFAGLVLTVIASIGGLAFRPLGDGIADLKVALLKMESRADRYVPREDLDARFAVGAQRRDDLQRLTDDRVQRLERDVDAVAKQVVPREEHKIVRELQQRDYDLLRNRIERVEGRFEKRADGLGRELEKLEDRAVPRVELQGQLDARDRAIGTLRADLNMPRDTIQGMQRRIDELERDARTPQRR